MTVRAGSDRPNGTIRGPFAVNLGGSSARDRLHWRGGPASSPAAGRRRQLTTQRLLSRYHVRSVNEVSTPRPDLSHGHGGSGRRAAGCGVPEPGGGNLLRRGAG